MSRRTARRLVVACCTCFAFAGAAAQAPERGLSEPDADPAERVYESIDEIVVGRVFLGRAERERLDRLRGRIDAAPAAGVPAPAAAEDPVRGAGYIKKDSGPLRIWRDGDFVSAGPAAAGEPTFPGEVRIVRHPAPADAGDDQRSAPHGDRRDDTGGT